VHFGTPRASGGRDPAWPAARWSLFVVQRASPCEVFRREAPLLFTRDQFESRPVQNLPGTQGVRARGLRGGTLCRRGLLCGDGVVQRRMAARITGVESDRVEQAVSHSPPPTRATGSAGFSQSGV